MRHAGKVDRVWGRGKQLICLPPPRARNPKQGVGELTQAAFN